MPRTTQEIAQLQRDLNAFTRRRLANVASLIVDGKLGHATRRRVKEVKFWLGYEGTLTDVVNVEFQLRLRNPTSLKYTTAARLARAAKRRSEQRRKAKRNVRSAQRTSGVAIFDGRPVAAWLVPYLQWARAHGWRGVLVSGWRDPAYSRSLCMRMCGRPSCPGRCAGLSSNHSGSVKPLGAADVSDYVRFGQLMRQCPLQPRIFNALGARDPVHFSKSGR